MERRTLCLTVVKVLVCLHRDIVPFQMSLYLACDGQQSSSRIPLNKPSSKIFVRCLLSCLLARFLASIVLTSTHSLRSYCIPLETLTRYLDSSSIGRSSINPAMEIIPYSSPASGSGYDYAPSSYYGGAVYAASKHSSRPRSTRSDYSSTSTAKTFGDPTRAGYVPGQAPPRFFEDERERAEWNSAPRSVDGRKYRASTRLRYEIGDGSMGSASSSSSRRSSASSRRSSKRGDSPIEDDWTIVPEDSISCFSNSQRVKGRRSSGSPSSYGSAYASSRGGESMYYERERTLVSSSSSRGNRDERIQMANERFVVERRPDWA